MSILSIPKHYISKRLIIKCVRPSDYSALMDFFDRDDQHFPTKEFGWPYDKEPYSEWGYRPTASLIRHFAAHFKRVANGTELYFFRKGANDIIGRSVISFDREHNLRIGYYVTPSMRRKGYGSEAHAAIVSELKRRYPKRQIIAEVNPDNRASIHTLRKNGFIHLGSANSRKRAAGEVIDRKFLIMVSAHKPR